MRVKGWSGRSRLAKVDLYTRGTVYLIVWTATAVLALVLMATSAPRPGPTMIVGPLIALGLGVVCARLTRRAMDAYLGQGPVPVRELWQTLAATAGTIVYILVLTALDGTDMMTDVLGSAVAVTVVPLATAHALVVPNRTALLAQLAMAAALYGPVALSGVPAIGALVVSLFAGAMAMWLAFTVKASLWVLAVMWELEDARDAQARLAVAEERLRFGRDLHDVMGRNLAVVALKSELAVQLARRGRPEAVDQMLEVQRIAQESQREVREVVRGYREADLRVELEGARSVLDAAGIVCTVVLGDVELPEEVRSTLGWVVREATTNVLRHGDARRCTISVGSVDRTALLVVENDGTGETGEADDDAGDSGAAPGGVRSRGRLSSDRPGSGLAGLRERLSAVGGVLEAGPGRSGCFRLAARIPLGDEGRGA